MCFTGWRGLDSSRSSLCACTSRFVREKLDITESMIFDDEGSESGATALPKPPWSFSPVNLALSVVRRRRLPSAGWLPPPLPVPAPLALVPRGRVSTEVGRPRQQKQRVSANPAQRRKNWEESTKTRCRRCRSPCVLASSVPRRRAKQPLPPAAQVDPTALATPEEN